jgi:hypothetical protein
MRLGVAVLLPGNAALLRAQGSVVVSGRVLDSATAKDSAHYLSMLSKTWPPKLKCGSGFSSGSSSRRQPNQAVIRWVVIWLR